MEELARRKTKALVCDGSVETVQGVWELIANSLPHIDSKLPWLDKARLFTHVGQRRAASRIICDDLQYYAFLLKKEFVKWQNVSAK